MLKKIYEQKELFLSFLLMYTCYGCSGLLVGDFFRRRFCISCHSATPYAHICMHTSLWNICICVCICREYCTYAYYVYNIMHMHCTVCTYNVYVVRMHAYAFILYIIILPQKKKKKACGAARHGVCRKFNFGRGEKKNRRGAATAPHGY